MSSEKYIGLDVHQATISAAVMDSQGKVVMESILETKASTILEFFAGLRGSLFVTFEEGTWAAWLYDLLKPHVSEVLVCNPRKIPLLKQGNKSDLPSDCACMISSPCTTAKPACACSENWRAVI
jgi:transposase